jgi:hypothetical protein
MEHGLIDAGRVRFGDVARVGVDEATDRHGIAAIGAMSSPRTAVRRSCPRRPMASAIASSRSAKAVASIPPQTSARASAVKSSAQADALWRIISPAKQPVITPCGM